MSRDIFGANLFPPPVLIVDDNEGDWMMFKSYLATKGIQADTVFNGEEAIAKIRMRDSIRHMYKLIIMDIDMPIKNGLDTTEELIQMK